VLKFVSGNTFQKFSNVYNVDSLTETIQQSGLGMCIMDRAPTRWWRGGNAPGRHFWWKEGI